MKYFCDNIHVVRNKKRRKVPKLRAWGKPSRKVMTMVIPSRKNKLKKRAKRKAKLRKELKKYGV